MVESNIPKVGDKYRSAEQRLRRKGQQNPTRIIIAVDYEKKIITGRMFNGGCTERLHFVDIELIGQPRPKGYWLICTVYIVGVAVRQ